MKESVLDIRVNKGQEYALKTMIQLLGDVQCIITGNGKLEAILYSPSKEENLRIYSVINIMHGVHRITEKHSQPAGGSNAKKYRNSFVPQQSVLC